MDTVPESHSPRRLSGDFIRLNIAQFCGALNDNMFKVLAILFLIHLHGADEAARINAFAAIAFVVPFLLFSAAAGVLADRLSKRNILVFCKGLEVVAMVGAVASFLFHFEAGLYMTLFLIGTHSALFSPSKYGIVPELVPRDQLPQANGLMTMATFLATVLGSAAAPFLAGVTHSNYALAQSACIVIACAGLGTMLLVRRTPPAGAQSRMSALFVRDIWRTFWSIRKDRYLLQACIASAYFLMLGAYMQLNLIPYGMRHLGLTEQQSGYLFFVASIGIALGAFGSGRLSGRNIEFGIAPLGALILAAGAVALKFAFPSLWLVGPCVFLAGLGAGLFVVPVDSFIQSQAPEQQRGEILAASSFLSWVGVLLASGLVMLTVKLGWSPATGFLMMGGLTLILVVFTLLVLPDFLLRFILLLLMRLAYRIRVIGAAHVPLEGAAVLVCNHVSHLDALLLVATQQRRIRFLMNRATYEQWRWLKPVFDLMGCIPIDPKGGSPKQLANALAAARAALADGFMVCVFAEGGLTRTGNIREFHRGFEYLVREKGYPVIPVYIGGAWGAITRYYQSHRGGRSPRLLRYPVTVLFGKPLPPTAKANDARLAVMELSSDYYQDRKPLRRPLGEMLAASARAAWNQPAVSDTTGKRLTFGRLLTAAVALAGKLKPLIQNQDKVGILLPPSAGGVLANLAVTLSGRTAVNLNFTASADSFRSALRQCDLKTVITSRLFLEKIGALPLPDNPVFVEDLAAAITPGEKLRAWLKARLLPVRLLARIPRFDPDRVAAILFSSGSTGEPKGIMLSHHNIISNIESLRAVFHSKPADNVCACLPLFHSLGYTGTLWFPLLSGFSAAYHPNPLDAGAIARVVRENKSTLLFATPTFLQLYLRKATREDFATLEFIIAGAEKLKSGLAEAFEERFGLRPLEGYGTTELSPVAALSLPHVHDGAVSQKGWKEGSVGLPLPGVAMKVVDPDTGRPLGVDEPGLLLVKGPNVMLGYLGRPDLTAEAIRDGWYRTGDVARIDSEGFVIITDRLSRFSKIGGEMVPHQGVEEELHRVLGAAGQVLAVTAAPDEKKGEKLVLLYTDEAGGPEAVAKAIDTADLPNLWKPGRDACFRIDAIPILGTGKTDLKTLKETGKRLAAGPANPPG
jgi:acyl-[acyl-carrier-protein]-phospholipid O-acyltransferase/long-chain-fatty-acid--[acyl-carrier-protein] ligase